MTTRRYEQRRRALAATQTRRRVLDAVYECLRRAPTQPVSIERVAELADVARSTIYLIFESRAGLFDALGADLLERGGFGQLLQATEHPDARQALRGVVRCAVEMYVAHREVLRTLHSMALLDADAVGGSIQRTERGRATGMAYLARRLAEQHRLRRNIDIDTAAHLLWLLTSFDSFDLLYTGRALSAETVSDLLATTAERTLCR